MRAALVIFAGVFLAVTARGAERLTLATGQPGNVFLAGAPVRVRVSGGRGPLRVSLVTYDGRQLPAPPLSSAGFDVPGLSRGYYELTVSDAEQTVTAPIVVVAAPRLRGRSRLATDAAHSWLIPPDRFATGAELLRRGGLAWVRERFSWPEIEPERGVHRWGKYEACVDEEHRRGLRVDEVFHMVPDWARADGATNRYPDDLRDAYRFFRTAARHFRGRVDSWEVWNEADISVFSPETGSEYAAFLKAAYLGIKAGDPHVLVTQVAMAIAAGRFEDTLYRNGTASYLDVFNYHIYADPRDYAARARGHFALLDRYHVPAVPVWLTEAGIPLPAGSGGDLSAADQRRQAEFIPKSYALSLAAGTDRHFFFVFPHYVENGTEFGSMDAGQNPYPGYAALATVTDMLGEARYLGPAELPAGPPLQAYLFDNGAGQTVVAWSDGAPVTLRVPSGCAVYNCVGAELTPSGGALAVTGSPVYLRAPDGTFRTNGPGPLTRSGAQPLPRLAGRELVLRLRLPDETVRKQSEEYEIAAGAAVPVQVEVYNFGGTARSGSVRLQAPPGWTVTPATFQRRFAPMGRAMFAATLTAGPNASIEPQELRGMVMPRSPTRWGPGLQQSSPAVLDVAVDPTTRPPSASRPLDLDRPSRWTDQVSGNGTMSRTGEPGGGISFTFRFHGAGDRWGYPKASFTPPADWRPYDGLRFEYATSRDDSSARVRLMLTERGGAVYFTESGFAPSRAWRRAFVPFRALTPAAFAPADANGRLDLDQVAALSVGANTGRDELTLRARNFELVRYKR